MKPYDTKYPTDEHPVMIFGFLCVLVSATAFFLGYNTALNDLRVQAYADAQGEDIYEQMIARQGK